RRKAETVAILQRFKAKWKNGPKRAIEDISSDVVIRLLEKRRGTRRLGSRGKTWRHGGVILIAGCRPCRGSGPVKFEYTVVSKITILSKIERSRTDQTGSGQAPRVRQETSRARKRHWPRQRGRHPRTDGVLRRAEQARGRCAL